MCRSLEELEAIASVPLQGIVYEPSFPDNVPYSQVARVLTIANCPLVVSAAFQPGEAEALADLARLRCDVVLPLDRGDDLMEAVFTLVHGDRAKSALGPIFTEIGPWVPNAIRSSFVIGAILAQRKVTVSQVAKMCRRAPSTIREAARAVRAPSPAVQTRWHPCLHGMWRMLILGLGEKQAADIGGFGSLSAFSHSVRNCSGKPIRAWRHEGGFDAALGEYTALWRRCVTK